LVIVNLDTLALHHNKAGVDAFDLGYQLLLRDWSGLGLLDELGGIIVLGRGGRAACRERLRLPMRLMVRAR